MNRIILAGASIFLTAAFTAVFALNLKPIMSMPIAAHHSLDLAGDAPATSYSNFEMGQAYLAWVDRGTLAESLACVVPVKGSQPESLQALMLFEPAQPGQQLAQSQLMTLPSMTARIERYQFNGWRMAAAPAPGGLHC